MRMRKASFREGVDTLVGSNSVFTGSIESEGTVRVDGKVIGDIKVTGDAYVGKGATVEGNMEAGNVHLAGTVKGNIIARGLLKILSTARLYGDIRINSFVADEALCSRVNARCSMSRKKKKLRQSTKGIIKRATYWRKSTKKTIRTRAERLLNWVSHNEHYIKKQ